MATPRYDQYLEYKTAIETALAAAGLSKVTVTAESTDIASGSRHGVLVFPPPELSFTTFEIYEATWEAIAIAGPADNLTHAWKTLDGMIEALFQANINMSTATPDTFSAKNSLPLPGYLITFNTETVYKETP